MGFHPFSAVLVGFQQLVNGKSEEAVALTAGAHVTAAGNTIGTLLPHDIHECPTASEDAGAESFDLQCHLALVVEVGEPLIVVQRQLILFGDLPDRNGDRAVLLRLDCKIGASFAPFEQEPVVLEFRSADDSCPWAAPVHLLDIEVASVGNVVAFHF